MGTQGFNYRRAAAGAFLVCLVAALVIWWDPVDLVRGNEAITRISALGSRILGIEKTSDKPTEILKEETPLKEPGVEPVKTEPAPSGEAARPTVETEPAPTPVAVSETPAMASELQPSADPMTPSIPEASADSGAMGPDQPLVRVEPAEPVKPAVTASIAEPKPTETVLEKPAMVHKPPESLGGVPIKRGETLSGMILNVYGILGPEILGRVVNANPHLEDLNKIPVNRTIYFPAAPQTVTATPEPRYWIRIAETETLADAFKMVRSSNSPRKLRVVPYFHPQTGVKFAVVLWSYYPNREEAQNQLDGLPGSIGDQAKVVTLYDPEGVYYADPFQRKQERSETY